VWALPELAVVPARSEGAGGKVPVDGRSSSACIMEFADTPNELLSQMRDIWQQILARVIDSDDQSFFELGGTSLQAMEMLDRVNQTFGSELGILALLENPAMGALAELVRQCHLGQSGQAPIRTGPLSVAQHELWMLAQLDRDASRAYNETRALALEGPLDKAVLRAVLAAVVHRHESLRTTFADDGTEQRVWASTGEVVLIERDLAPDADIDSASEWIAREGAEVIDLGRGPLYRFTLARLRPELHVLGVTVHHIVSDGESFNILFRDLVRGLSGSGSPEDAPPMQQIEYVLEQRRRAAGAGWPAAERYWMGALEGARVTSLAAFIGGAGRRTYRGGRVVRSCDARLTQRLRDAATAAGCTVTMGLLAAYVLVLGRLGRTDEVVIAVAGANRTYPRSQTLVGYAANPLLLRWRLDRNAPFSKLLADTRAAVLQALAHQEYPFGNVASRMGENAALATAFSSGLDQSPRHAGRLLVRPVPTPIHFAHVELKLEASVRGEEHVLFFDYSEDRLERGVVEAVADAVVSVVSMLDTGAERRLSEFVLTQDEQRQQLLRFGLGERTEQTKFVSVLERFEAAVRRAPLAIAVEDGTHNISYIDLKRRAGECSRRLRAAGARPGDVVAIKLEPGIEFVVAVLGVLGAGAAYLPIANGQPTARTEFMLTDSAAAWSITRSADDAVALHAPRSRLNGPLLEEQLPARQISDQDLAYIIYTSGSTGKPKGVMISHGGLAHFVRSHDQLFACSARTRGAQVCSLSFDASVMEIWPVLCGGGTLVIGDQDVIKDPRGLQAWLLARRVTLCLLPTPIGELVVGLPWPSSTPLEHLLLGGDRLKSHPPKGLPFEVANAFGPTETTAWCSCKTNLTQGKSGLPPIGRPVLDTELYVLDGDGHPIPPGAVGELYVGGKGLARGYLKRPDLTAERFVPSPYGVGERLYRTGDLVRWSSDGELEFVGRADRQLKIRGYRVELGEIEGLLAAHPAVLEAAVVAAQAGDTAEPRIAAYFVSREGAAGSEDLREYLKRHLSEQMLPNVLIPLDTLPKDCNGKIDRRALEALAIPRLELGAARAPVDAVELRIREIWEDCLNVRGLGCDADFFDAGGTSLGAVRMLSRINSEFDLDLPVAALQELRTVAELAAFLRCGEKQLRLTPTVRITRGRGRDLFLFHPIGGTILCYSPLGAALGSGLGLVALQYPGTYEDRPAIIRDYVTLASEYVEAIQKVQPQGPYLLGGFCAGGVVALETARQLRALGEQVEHLVFIDTGMPNRDRSQLSTMSEVLNYFYMELTVQSGNEPRDLKARLAPLELEDGLRLILHDAQELGILPAEAKLATIRRLYASFDANVAAYRRYLPTPIDVPFTVIQAEEVPEELRSNPSFMEPGLGWSEYTTRGIRVWRTPGSHYTLMRAQNVPAVAALIERAVLGGKHEMALPSQF